MMTARILVALSLLLPLHLHLNEAAAAQESDPRQAALRVLEARRDAVITVKLVIRHKASFQGREMDPDEYRSEVSGTLLDASGLIVLSLIGANPAELFSFMDFPSPSGERPSFQSEFAEVTILLSDGTQTRGRVVLRDPDLDLLFIRAEKLDPAWRPLPEASGPDPKPLEEIVVIGRLGTLLDHTAFVDLARVRAVLKKPRPLFVLDYELGESSRGVGLPVFDLSGLPLGILAVRRPGEGQTISPKTMALGGFHLDTVVVPWHEVREVAGQAAASEAAKTDGGGAAAK